MSYPKPPLSQRDFDLLQALDTCTVSNAVEALKVRLRNEGFAHGSIRCQFPHLPPMLGYAVTGSIRSSTPPMKGSCYYDRMDFWRHVQSIPEPRVIVMRDRDPIPGLGALFGEVHTRICQALHCSGYVTNGSVRDVDAVEPTGFHLFAGNVAVSHAYAHIVDFGEPVEVGGLKIREGNLIHGDRHGIHTIPASVAADIPRVAAQLIAKERELIEFCKSSDFTLDGLAARFDAMRHVQPCD